MLKRTRLKKTKQINITFGFMVLAFLLSGVFTMNAATDEERSKAIKETLLSLKVDVVEAKVLDGRPNGGIRALLVTFKTNEKPEEHAKELINIFQSGSVLNTKTDASITSVVAVAGSKDGKTRAIITVDIKDTETFLTMKDSKTFLSKWKVNLLDRSYLPAFSTTLGWLKKQ